MKNFRKLEVLIVALALLCIGVEAGATQFTFSFSGTGISGNGMLWGDKVSGTDYYQITSGYANVDSKGTFTIYGNPNQNSNYSTSPLGLFWYNDSLYAPQKPLVDYWGLLFTKTPDSELNIWSPTDFNGYYTAYIGVPGSYQTQSTDVTFTAAPVPEPGTIMLLGAGFFGLTVFCKRRKA